MITEPVMLIGKPLFFALILFITRTGRIWPHYIPNGYVEMRFPRMGNEDVDVVDKIRKD